MNRKKRKYRLQRSENQRDLKAIKMMNNNINFLGGL